jgi:hypothetical protein
MSVIKHSFQSLLLHVSFLHLCFNSVLMTLQSTNYFSFFFWDFYYSNSYDFWNLCFNLLIVKQQSFSVFEIFWFFYIKNLRVLVVFSIYNIFYWLSELLFCVYVILIAFKKKITKIDVLPLALTILSRVQSWFVRRCGGGGGGHTGGASLGQNWAMVRPAKEQDTFLYLCVFYSPLTQPSSREKQTGNSFFPLVLDPHPRFTWLFLLASGASMAPVKAVISWVSDCATKVQTAGDTRSGKRQRSRLLEILVLASSDRPAASSAGKPARAPRPQPQPQVPGSRCRWPEN